MLGEAVESYRQYSGAGLHRFIQKPSFLIITQIRTEDVMAGGGSGPERHLHNDGLSGKAELCKRRSE